MILLIVNVKSWTHLSFPSNLVRRSWYHFKRQVLTLTLQNLLLCLVSGVDLREWIWRNLNGLYMD